MKIIIYISRILVGALLLFSGFVKSVDPMGGAIKFEEYFTAFSMEWLTPFSMTLSIILSVSEMVLGSALIIGIYKRVTSWIAAIFMLFFTLLTLVLYFTNPVADCGCFGDAVVMTHGETLLKNIITLIVLTPFFIYSQRYSWLHSDRNKFIVLVISLTASLFAPLYAISYLPLIDFLPYKEGVNIFKSMEIPEGAEKDQYETTLIYKEIATGKNVEFSIEDTTWYDQSRWKYVDTKTKLVKKGYTPAITSFNIFDGEGNDVTKDILLTKDSIAVVIINKDKIYNNKRDNLNEINIINSRESIKTIFVSKFDREQIAEKFNIDIYNVYNGDETLLKSLMRAPIGVVIFSDSVIISKKNLTYER